MYFRIQKHCMDYTIQDILKKILRYTFQKMLLDLKLHFKIYISKYIKNKLLDWIFRKNIFEFENIF